MTDSQTYLSDMRPRFDGFEVDCGKIGGYRYGGGAASEPKAGKRPSPSY
jgi:hypothetical protein